MTRVPCMLEIDHDRGVIYAHLTSDRDVKRLKCATILRIGTTPRPIPEGSLDIGRDPNTGVTKYSWDSAVEAPIPERGEGTD